MRHRSLIALVVLIALVSLPLSAQDTSDNLVEVTPHKFFDRQQLTALYIHSGLRLADTIKTCRELAHGGTEDWIPVHSCGGIAGWQVGSVGLTLGVGWLLHKRGNHRLERIAPWVGSGAAAAGLTKSVFNIH